MKPIKNRSYVALFSIGENIKATEDYIAKSTFDVEHYLSDKNKSLLTTDSQNDEISINQTSDLEPLATDQIPKLQLENSHLSESEQEVPKIEEEGIEDLGSEVIQENEDSQEMEVEHTPETAPEDMSNVFRYWIKKGL